MKTMLFLNWFESLLEMVLYTATLQKKGNLSLLLRLTGF